eukprot:Sspe_Gene.8962::Locus_3019_Transcript_2_2_Confidence_0.667_Length_7694::g.8962::m.8962
MRSSGDLEWSTDSSSPTLTSLLANAQGMKRVAVPETLMNEGPATHRVCVRAGQETACQQLEVAPSPPVLIEEGTVITHRVDKPLSLHARPLNTSMHCSLMDEDYSQPYSYQWVSTALLPRDVDTALSVLHLPPSVLPPSESHAFTVTACSVGTAGCKKGRVVVHTMPPLPSLIPNVDGVGLPSTGSFSLTVATSLTDVQWRCDSCLTSGALVADGVELLLRGDSFRHGVHTLSVSGQQQGVTARATVTVTSPVPNTATMRSLSHPGQPLLPATDTVLLSVALEAANATNGWEWSLSPTTHGGVTAAGNTLRAQGSLLAGVEYSARAEAAVGGTTSHVSRIFSTYPAPARGRCVVTPKAGDLTTRFRVACDGWETGSHPLTYRFFRLSPRRDIGGGWRPLPEEYFFLHTSAQQSQTVQLEVHVRSADGAIVAASGTELQLLLTGTTTSIDTLARSAWENGNMDQAVSLVHDGLLAQGMSSWTNTSLAVLQEAAQGARSPSTLEQVVQVLCTVVDTKAVSSASASGLSGVVESTAARLRMSTLDSPEARGCVARAIGVILPFTVGDPVAAVKMRRAVDALLASGPHLPGSESTDEGGFSVGFRTVQGNVLSAVVQPFAAQSRALPVTVTFPALPPHPSHYRIGVSMRVATASLVPMWDGGRVVNATVAGHVVGVVARRGETAVTQITAEIAVPLLGEGGGGLTGVYFDEAKGMWATDGVALTALRDGVGLLRTSHLTDFTV